MKNISKKSKGYNGYKNYNQWNQSLWINNDEGLYYLAKECIEATDNRDEAISLFLANLDILGIAHTPDGVKWSKAGIRAALVGM